MQLKPGYKQTEVGIIPEDWSVEAIGSVLGKVSSGLSRKLKSQDVGVPVLISGNIQNSKLCTKEFKYWFRPDPQGANVDDYILNDGDILLCFINSMSQIGKPCIFRDIGRPAIYTTNLFRIVVSKKTTPEFVFFLFGTKYFQNQVQLMAKPAVNQASFTKPDLLSIKIPLPPTKAEQEAIAEALSDTDAWIESLEQLIAKKRRIKEGSMQALLTGKQRLPGFVGEWEVKTLGDIVDTDPENLGSNTLPDYSFNYISLEDVNKGTLCGSSEQNFVSAPSRARRILRKNDVLVSTVRPNLKSHLLFNLELPNWICSTGFCVVRCRKGISNPKYIYAHIFAHTVNSQIDTLLTGSNYPAINSRDVRALKIPTPEYAEQTAIAAILSDMDSELDALEAKLSKARQIKQGMMQELLTGKTRLV